MYGEDIQKVQRFLVRHGYSNIKTNGNLNEVTKTALRSFIEKKKFFIISSQDTLEEIEARRLFLVLISELGIEECLEPPAFIMENQIPPNMRFCKVPIHILQDSFDIYFNPKEADKLMEVLKNTPFHGARLIDGPTEPQLCVPEVYTPEDEFITFWAKENGEE